MLLLLLLLKLCKGRYGDCSGSGGKTNGVVVV